MNAPGAPAGRGHWPSLAAAAGMALFFGLTFPAQKVALGGLPPLTMTALRNLIALAALAPIHFFLDGARPPRLAALPWKLALGLACIEPCLYYSFESFGVRLGTASGAALLVGVIPVEVLLIQIARGRHRARLPEWGALGLSVAGATLVAGRTGGGWLPSLLMFGAATCASAYAVLYEGAQGALPPLTLTLFQAAVGAVFFGAPALLLEPASRAPAAWPRAALEATLYLGLGGSIVAYFLWNYALRHRPARVVSLFSNLVPPFGALSASLWLGEPLRPAVWLGGALVVAAATLAVALEPTAPATETA